MFKHRKPDTRKPGAFLRRVMPAHVEVQGCGQRHGRGWAVVMFGFTPFMLAATTTSSFLTGNMSSL